MGAQLGFWVDVSKCTACKACEIACKNRNNLGVGPRLRRVNQIERGTYPDLTVLNISLSCMHCAKPACVGVCPTGAISKRSQDGIVVVDRNRCIGCRYCLFACPFGAPQFGLDGLMIKCDMCLEFQQIGKEPACVSTCFYGALHFGPLDELADLAAERTARRLAGSTEPSVLVSR